MIGVYPSNLFRVMACTASPALEALCPKRPHKAADEGKLAHMAAGAILSGRDADSCNMEPDMHQHVMGYVELCRKIAAYSTDGVHIEEKFRGPWFNGILDFFSFSEQLGRLSIRDLKYGRGWVEAPNNWQLIAYALLLLPEPDPRVKVIDLGIYQPRAHHPGGPDRWWTITPEQLEVFRAQLNQTMADVKSGVTATCSGDHCRYCRAIIGCLGVERALAYAIDVTERAEFTKPSPEQLALDMEIIARASRLIGDKKAALEQHVSDTIQAGTIVPGWEISNTVGAAKWAKETDATLAYGDMLGVDLRKPPEAITPTQAKTRKLISEDAFKALSFRPNGGYKLQKVNMEKIRSLLK